MGEDRRAATSRRAITQMVAIGLIASALGIAAGLAIDWFPVQASSQAKKIDTLWDVLIIVSVPIFVLVCVVVLYSVKNFRMRPGEESLDGPPIHGNTRVEIVWTALPAIILVSLCSYAYITLTNIEEAPAAAAQELHVDVLGQQFAWTYTYTAPGGKKINTTHLYLPKGRSVRFSIRAKDVIHDFWVPAFRMKSDAVPGVVTHYRVTPTRLGTYPAVCAELCGLGHAVMRSEVTVMPPRAFAAWMDKQVNPPAAAGGQTATLDGKTLFTKGNGASTACASCHQLADAGTPMGVGPDLDKGLAGRDATFIKESIVAPEKEITKGFPAGVMPPNYGQVLKPAELDTLVKYLSEVTKK